MKYGQFHQRKRKSRSSLPTATHHSCYTNATSACGQGLGDVPAQRESALWNVLLYRVSGGCVSFFCGQPFLFKFADGVQLCRHTIFESFDFSYIFGGSEIQFPSQDFVYWKLHQSPIILRLQPFETTLKTTTTTTKLAKNLGLAWDL